ncbi:MAG: TonB-dependent receptor [Ignavibacteriae bacterium]|nr:TonB-dependent receptor [Ignavibacteriota bacterium]NOG97081.1 TonB-dependent receptor [Ignavibacteriota bacterium]
MKKNLRFIILISISILFTSSYLFSQTGKISGRVTDAATGEALPFVNIIILETSLGAASDIDGYYSILNVRPGTYSIKASAIGFTSVTFTDVQVSIDLTTDIDFKLNETSLELGEEIVVVAEKPLVTKDLTASTALIGADEIASLPVTEFTEVLQLKAGIVSGRDGFNVRGGRRGEVSYTIDGVNITDSYDGSTIVDVNASAIQELQFISGAFNAEYGKALSGVINLSTKEGDNDFNFTATSYIGDYLSSRNDIFTGIDKFEPAAIRNLEGSLSGPIIKDRLHFYTNARYIFFDGWLKGREVYNPWDLTSFDGSAPIDSQYTFEQTGSGEIVAMNFNEKVYLQGKLTLQLLTTMKVTFNYINERKRFQDYNHFYKLNPNGRPKKFQWGNTNIVSLTHTIGANTFYQLSGSYFFKRFSEYVYSDVNNPNWVHDRLREQQPQNGFSFSTGGQDNNTFKRLSGSYAAKFDITSQVSRTHQIKFGFEFNRNNLFFEDITLLQYIDGYFNGEILPELVNGRFDPGEDGILDPSISGNPFVDMRVPDINDPKENLAINVYERKPTEISAYIQDKIELNDMIVNLGIRFDYFQPDGFVLADPSDPDIYRPKKVENLALSIDERRAIWYKDAEAKIQFSPRLGVAFPITDRGVIHFSYGHFFQVPNYDLLYRNPEFKLAVAGENLGIVGNSDLKPEQTISGEVGLQQAMTDELSLDITGYFRDIKDLTGTRADKIRLFGGAGSYAQFVNSDFGFVKGIIFSLNKRFSNNWAASIDYTLQSAKGNASDPSTYANQISGGQEPEIQLVPLNWDQTHTVNVTFNYSGGPWGFSMIGQYGSGFPYTPSQSENLTKLLTNSLMQPATVVVDLRAYYEVEIFESRLNFFARIQNLFDIRNEVNVYNDSGTADFTLAEQLRRTEGQLELVNSINEFYRNPTFYSEPRRVEVGVTFTY